MVQRSSNECIIKARSAMAKRRGQHLVPQVFPACILIPCHALVAISKRIRYARARIPREDARSGNFKQYFRIFSTLTEQCSLDTRTWRTPQTYPLRWRHSRFRSRTVRSSWIYYSGFFCDPECPPLTALPTAVAPSRLPVRSISLDSWIAMPIGE